MAETTLISVHIPKDVAKRLADLAEATGRSKSDVAGQAIEEFLTLHEWQVKAIRQGIAEANAGKLMRHDEAVKRIKRWRSRTLALARTAVSCNSCFTDGRLTRAGIGMVQPFSVGAKYRPGGVAVISINPGAAKDGGYKEARKQALDRFTAGDDSALTDYWAALGTDPERFWNPKYLARLRRLGFAVDSIVVGNIALCATANNKYPNSILWNCWSRHSSQMIEALCPGVVVLMGRASVMDKFGKHLGASNLRHLVIPMAHFAHRKGNAYEDAECARVRKLLSQKV